MRAEVLKGHLWKAQERGIAEGVSEMIRGQQMLMIGSSTSRSWSYRFRQYGWGLSLPPLHRA